MKIHTMIDFSLVQIFNWTEDYFISNFLFQKVNY